MGKAEESTVKITGKVWRAPFCSNINGGIIRSNTFDASGGSTDPTLSMEAPSRFSILLSPRRTSTGSDGRNCGSRHRYSSHASETGGFLEQALHQIHMQRNKIPGTKVNFSTP